MVKPMGVFGALFSCTQARTPEAYRRQLESRLRLARLVVVLGAVTVLFGLLAVRGFSALPESRQSFLSGFYAGLGIAVLAAGLAVRRGIRSLLCDDNKLKSEFIRVHDERNREVSSRAMRSAGCVVCVTLYAVLLFAGLFSFLLFWFCFCTAIGFTLLYLAFSFYYSRTI